MIPNAILIHSRNRKGTRTALGQPEIPADATVRLKGELKRSANEAARRAAGIVSGAEWSVLLTLGHGIDKGDRLEIEWAVTARPGSIFRVLDILPETEGTTDQKLLLQFEPAKAVAA